MPENGNRGDIRMWPSEEWASRVYDWANLGLIVGLVIGVISTVLVVWMGNVKEAYLPKQVAETNKSAALANERAADAKKTATVAEQGTADALAEQELLRNKNLILESQLLGVRKQSEARRLTGEQKRELIKLLSGGDEGVAIVSPIADGEASDFADDFDSALQAAHWQTLRIRNRITTKFGVSLVTVEGTVLARTKRLSDALTAVGISHETNTLKTSDTSLQSISPKFEVGYLYLVIEHKPFPNVKNPH